MEFAWHKYRASTAALFNSSDASEQDSERLWATKLFRATEIFFWYFGLNWHSKKKINGNNDLVKDKEILGLYLDL